MNEVLIEMQAMRQELAAMRALFEEALHLPAAEVAPEVDPQAHNAPLTAKQLAVRWGIYREQDWLRMLGRRCRKWGLRPLRGTRGKQAQYAVDAILRVEALAQPNAYGLHGGLTMKRRRTARKKGDLSV